ncbi:MAG TPA: ABC transporter substrate-binding protein [Anaerolineaceae bacterium]
MTQKSIHHRIVFSILAIILVINVSGCSRFTSQAGLPPKATEPAALTPTSEPTATPIPSDTPAPIATKTKAPTFTPVPSPTPAGYHEYSTAGFSITVPTTWEAKNNSETRIVLTSQADRMMVFITSSEAKTSSPFVDMIEKTKSDFGDSVKFALLADGEIQLADGVSAQSEDFTVTYADSTDEARLAYAHLGTRDYVIVITTSVGGLKVRRQTISKVLGTVHLFAPKPFGLPRDQTLVMLGSEPDPTDLDPAVTSSSAADYVGLLYSGLVRLTPDLKVVPALASTWTISDDGLVYPFNLPADLKFASGKALTAKDVKDSWERACDPKTNSTTARTYLGDIVGVKDKLDKKAKEISGVKVVDPHTLEVTLDGPKPYFLAKLTYPTAAVLDVSSVKSGTDWVFSANASGPYKLREHVKEEKMIFERNPNYPVPAGIPYVGFITNPGGSGFSLYQDGTIDLIGVASSNFNQFNSPSDPLHNQLVTGVSMCTDLLQFKPGSPPTDDPNVRKALVLAFDKNAIQKKLGLENWLVAPGILPPAMPGYLSDRQGSTFDLAAAKEALKASKYGSSIPPLKLVTPGLATDDDPYIKAVADMWHKNLGIQVTVEKIDYTTLTKSARASKGNVVNYSWCADYPDPENFLDVLYHSASEFNVGSVQDTALDKLLEQARTEADPAQRLKLYQQAETLILDQNYALPTLYHVIGELVSPRVKGFVLSPIHAAAIPWLTLESDSQ